MITFQTLKNMAKTDMKTVKPSVFKASILLFVIALIFSLLITYLSGYDRYMTNMGNILAEVYQNPEKLQNPTEDFIIELAEEIEAATPKIKPAAIVLIAVIIIMQGLVSAGFEGYCLKVSRREEAKVLDIMRSFEHFGKALALMIIRAIAVAVGFVFFFFPGILAYYSFSQCFMIMYDHPDYSVFRCLKESAKLMRGHKMALFILQISFIVWHIVSDLITSVIGIAVLQIYTKPYIGLSQAHFYNCIACPEIYASRTDAPPPQQ